LEKFWPLRQLLPPQSPKLVTGLLTSSSHFDVAALSAKYTKDCQKRWHIRDAPLLWIKAMKSSLVAQMVVGFFVVQLSISHHWSIG